MERWFALLTEKQLRRGVHCSTRELEEAIKQYLAISNESPNLSYGPKQLMKYLLLFPDFVIVFLTQETSSQLVKEGPDGFFTHTYSSLYYPTSEIFQQGHGKNIHANYDLFTRILEVIVIRDGMQVGCPCPSMPSFAQHQSIVRYLPLMSINGQLYDKGCPLPQLASGIYPATVITYCAVADAQPRPFANFFSTLG